MKYKCVIFDCDGTLLDTLGDIAFSMNRSLAVYGYPVIETEKYRDMAGWGIYRLASLALPENARTETNINTVGSFAARFMEELASGQQEEKSMTKPYPGIRELVTELSNLKTPHSKKIVTAVLSNKPDSALRCIINGHFPPAAFDAVLGLRPGMTAKPDPSMVWELLAEMGRLPQDTIFMGDSEIDMETARNSGCFPLGVSWGFRSRATLEKAGAARIIDRPDELWEILN
ncbi:MAG: HAD family hydrolase [Treponema sp.]|nr:HAD family hydrolase [Treponema sp.]